MTMEQVSPTVAILIANGAEEKQITAVQRALTASEVTYKMIAPEQGLVNGWQNGAWGHYFTVDEPISTAMGSDYDCLVLVGGERATSKLKENLHTRRIVNHFLEANKPVAAIETGVDLLSLSAKSAGLSVSAKDSSKELLDAAQMEVMGDEQVTDGYVLTSNGQDIDGWVDAALGVFSRYMNEMQMIEAQLEEQAA